MLLNRGNYWQCAFVIPKGSYETVREAGLNTSAALMRTAPLLAGRTGPLDSWDVVKVLPVTVDRLEQWCRPGLLCIGDAAHAMSPIGGAAINLAIQDAVAAARILAPALRRGVPDIATLRRVQRRRNWPTRATQRLQMLAQDRIIRPVLSGGGGKLPLHSAFSTASRCCAASRRGCSAWASVPSISRRETGQRRAAPCARELPPRQESRCAKPGRDPPPRRDPLPDRVRGIDRRR